MKLLVKQLRKIISEEVDKLSTRRSGHRPTIKIVYFDMDGVLADYDGGMAHDSAIRDAQLRHDRLFDKLPEKYKMMSAWSFSKALASFEEDHALSAYKEARSELNNVKNLTSFAPGFFENLSVVPGAKNMVDEAVKLFGNVGILSSPVDPRDMPEVKRQCIAEKNAWLDRHFPGVFSERIFDKAKHKYASPSAILIDDRTKNTVPFEKAGGTSILFRDSQSVIEELQSMHGP